MVWARAAMGVAFVPLPVGLPQLGGRIALVEIADVPRPPLPRLQPRHLTQQGQRAMIGGRAVGQPRPGARQAAYPSRSGHVLPSSD